MDKTAVYMVLFLVIVLAIMLGAKILKMTTNQASAIKASLSCSDYCPFCMNAELSTRVLDDGSLDISIKNIKIENAIGSYSGDETYHVLVENGDSYKEMWSGKSDSRNIDIPELKINKGYMKAVDSFDDWFVSFKGNTIYNMHGIAFMKKKIPDESLIMFLDGKNYTIDIGRIARWLHEEYGCGRMPSQNEIKSFMSSEKLSDGWTANANDKSIIFSHGSIATVEVGLTTCKNKKDMVYPEVKITVNGKHDDIRKNWVKYAKNLDVSVSFVYATGEKSCKPGTCIAVKSTKDCSGKITLSPDCKPKSYSTYCNIKSISKKLFGVEMDVILPMNPVLDRVCQEKLSGKPDRHYKLKRSFGSPGISEFAFSALLRENIDNGKSILPLAYEYGVCVPTTDPVNPSKHVYGSYKECINSILNQIDNDISKGEPLHNMRFFNGKTCGTSGREFETAYDCQEYLMMVNGAENQGSLGCIADGCGISTIQQLFDKYCTIDVDAP